MYDTPLIFFHRHTSPTWKPNSNPALQNLATLNDASRVLLPSLTICVSKPDALMRWLEKNSANLITDPDVFVDPILDGPTPERWCVLFEKLRQGANNIQKLRVYWDAEGFLFPGLGKNVTFVRGLVRLRVQKSVDIAGFYAVQWPGYMEEELGLKPTEENLRSSQWVRFLRDFQRGTEGLNPRV